MRLFLICFCWVLVTFVSWNASGQNLETIDTKTPIKVSSGLNISTSVYHIKGNEHRQQPFNWFISGTPTLHLYGIAIPFSFYYSNQSLGYQQPFNQLGISPSYKWAKLHAGYSSVHFSDYTLAGRRFYGAGTELTPGKFRFGFVYGRFQQAVEQDSIIRPTPGSFLGELSNGAFSRKGYALKVGYGSADHFFDVIIMQAADDITSVKENTTLNLLEPESNIVVGIKYRMKLGSHWFWDGDMASSYYTRDTRFSAIDSIGAIPSFGGQDFQPRLSSQLLYAGNTQFGYQSRNFRAGVKYRRIARDFKTMGAYYFQTDIEEIGLNANTFLFKRKLNLRGSLGLQSDNLDGNRQQTTSRVVGSAIVGWQINQRLRLDGVMTNFGIQQRNTITGLLDSVRVDQVANSYQLQSRYQFKSTARPQSIGATFTVQSLAPRSRALDLIIDTKSYQYFVFYSYMIPEYRLGITANVHHLKHVMDSGNTKSQGLGLNGTYALKTGKLNFNGGVRYYANSFAQESTGSTKTIDGGIQGRITQRWNLSLQLRYLTTAGSLNNPNANFSEYFGQVSTGINF